MSQRHFTPICPNCVEILGILKLAQETFTCCICLCVSMSPVRCPECQALIGCRDCVDGWLAHSCHCPKCRHPWPSYLVLDEQCIKGFDDWLAELKDY